MYYNVKVVVSATDKHNPSVKSNKIYLEGVFATMKKKCDPNIIKEQVNNFLRPQLEAQNKDYNIHLKITSSQLPDDFVVYDKSDEQ